jgi:aryl-alcohol dehydrogenase
LGATHAVNSKNAADLAAEINKIVPLGVDYSFDTTGAPACLKAALTALHRGGTGAGVAVAGPVEVERWSHLFASKKWIGVIEGDSIPQLFIPRLIEMYKAGIFPFDQLISFHRFEDINGTFKAMRNGAGIKSVLLME